MRFLICLPIVISALSFDSSFIDTATGSFATTSSNVVPSSVSISSSVNVNNLPRLYVGPSLALSFVTATATATATTTATSTKSAPPSAVALLQGTRVRLTPEQCHYVTKVLRLFRKQRRKSNHGGPAVPSVRIFDGTSGEWLAHIVTTSTGTSSMGTSSIGTEESIMCGGGQGGEVYRPTATDNQANDKRKKQRKRKRSSDVANDELLWAECRYRIRPQPSPSLRPPWVFFAPLQKKNRVKLMVEKCTELGAAAFFPVTTTRSDCGDELSPSRREFDVHLDNNNNNNNRGLEQYLNKLSLIALEASEQSERLTVPSIIPYDTTTTVGDKERRSPSMVLCDLESLLRCWTTEQGRPANHDHNESGSTAGTRVLMVCRERSSSCPPILHALTDHYDNSPPGSAVAFLVGPEGGWSPEEELLFDTYCDTPTASTVRSVSLGSMILRAETAAIMAVGAWALNHSATTNTSTSTNNHEDEYRYEPIL